MARPKQNPPLRVLLNGRDVGMLSRASSGAVDFAYSRDWLDWDHAIPVSLSLPLREDRYIGAPVLAVFENLLPDNTTIRERVAARVKASGTDAFSLLGKIGKDCVGALQFLADGADAGRPGAIEGHPVSDEEIERRIKNLKADPLGMTGDEDFRISLAGAQEKTALLRWRGNWVTPYGTTPTTHILKPEVGRLPNGVDLGNGIENEFICLKLCQAFGLDAAHAEIENFAGSKVLVVERFDRQWTRDGRLLRRPQEDMCQALSVPPTLKYQADGGPDNQQIMELLKGSDDPLHDQRAYLRAQMTFWLLGATDGHAKNFSIFLTPGGRFRMTPLYDVLTAQPSVDAGHIGAKAFKLAMSVGNGNHYRVGDIQPRHLIETAARSRFDGKLVEEDLLNLLASAEATAEQVLNTHGKYIPAFLAESLMNGIGARVRTLARWHDQAKAKTKRAAS